MQFLISGSRNPKNIKDIRYYCCLDGESEERANIFKRSKLYNPNIQVPYGESCVILSIHLEVLVNRKVLEIML